jgi:4'-phosphopantetheinyl transferase
MRPINLSRTVSRALSIRRKEACLQAQLVLAFEDDVSCLNELAAEFLGSSERLYFSALRFERRQMSYLLGRYAAKLALSHVFSEPDLRNIEITRGVFEQPIVQCRRTSTWCVTISHADSLAVAVAYPAGHPMGVDLERVDPLRYETIVSQLSAEEKQWATAATTDQLEIVTALWTAKEALSKALVTGLMAPIEIYTLAQFRQIESGLWEGHFKNFAQYKVLVWAGASYVLSIAMPKRSTIDEIGDLRSAL